MNEQHILLSVVHLSDQCVTLCFSCLPKLWRLLLLLLPLLLLLGEFIRTCSALFLHHRCNPFSEYIQRKISL